MKKSIFVIMCCLTVWHVHSIDQLMIHELRKEFLQLEDELWKFILTEHSDNSVDPGITIIRRFYDFDTKLKEMPQDILHGMQVVRETKPFYLLYSDFRIIHDMYEKFRRYQLSNLIPTKNDHLSYTQQITIADMVNGIFYNEENNVNATLGKIYVYLFGNDRDNVIEELFDIVSPYDYNCNYDQPSQQVFYNLYNTVALIDLKGYIMMQFGYLAKRLQEKGNNAEESLVSRELYKDRSNNTLSILRGTMEITNTKKWMCDPAIYTEGKNYIQVTRLLQGHIQNEVDLNEHGTCRENCATYSYTRNYGCYDWESAYCQKRKPCNGRILNCRFVESDMTACFSSPNSLRRYEYVQYESGRRMGEKSSCYNRNVDSWWRWFVHCSYCLCLCDEQGPFSDRYISTRPVMADVENNRVVTGLRIIKHNRIIHLQIQEGKLLPYGYIDNNTVRWVPVDDFKITDRGVESGEDYFVMTYEHRKLQLDELTPHQSNHILTGVRFEYLDGFLRFQINVRAFDFKTGHLSSDSHYVYGTGWRMNINLANSDIPTKSSKNDPEWDSGRYVEFTHTDFDKDIAQTTIPFIDSQPVTIYPQVPLRGAGIHYKGKPGYGGFIAPSIKTYDFSKHMELEFPDPPKREDAMEYLEVFAN